MPFKSKAQRRFLHATNPELAQKWEKKYKTSKNLPSKLKKRKKK